jgi:hypothetical protein
VGHGNKHAASVTSSVRRRSAGCSSPALHLDLTLTQWAADGLLAIFFFVAGLELKREFVAGDLRDVRRAVLPVAAAVGGMVAPAGIYLAVNATVAGVLLGFAVPVRGWRNTSNTGGGHCPPVSRCRCSRSSPPGCRSPTRATRSPSRSRSASSPAWPSARPPGVFGRVGVLAGSLTTALLATLVLRIRTGVVARRARVTAQRTFVEFTESSKTSRQDSRSRGEGKWTVNAGPHGRIARREDGRRRVSVATRVVAVGAAVVAVVAGVAFAQQPASTTSGSDTSATNNDDGTSDRGTDDWGGSTVTQPDGGSSSHGSTGGS